MSFDYGQLEYERPADKVKTIDVGPIPERIFDNMKKYEVAALDFNIEGFERLSDTEDVSAGGIFVAHRPADAQVSQIYRIPSDPASTDLERLTYFDTGTGRRINHFLPVLGEDWRGVWRGGGALMVMDLDGNEMFQLWRYWEDAKCDQVIPKIDGELDNSPGRGRIERLTHDEFRYAQIMISESNRLMFFTSNKENQRDTLIYMTKLIDSDTGAEPNSERFELPSKLVTPIVGEGTTTTCWMIASISVDDRYLALTLQNSSSYRPLYILDISDPEPGKPCQIRLPGATELEEETTHSQVTFSRDPTTPHLLYMGTNAFGDFLSIMTYDITTHSITHITTPEPGLHAIRPISWDIVGLQLTTDYLYFRANIEGWYEMFVMPLSGPHNNTFIQVKLDWDGGSLTFSSNAKNGRPWQLVLKQSNYHLRGSLSRLDLKDALKNVQFDEKGEAYINVSTVAYQQAQAAAPSFATHPPQLMKYKSFDGLEIPAMYYHPNKGKKAVPAVILMHGGPASQSSATSQIPTHGYILNELNCAIIYPNVRGSQGYGKRFMAADDVYKREDSVRDIGALLDHIRAEMKDEIDPDRIAAMGGSYGGYMTFACLTHFSSQLACGLANCGIAHWPSLLRNTASHRRAHRRKEYGDETDPEVLKFLEDISPLNNAEKINIPVIITHGDNDSRVPVEEALRMWDIVKKKGVHAELIIGEKEGHGFKQKSVIEYCNAARNHFLERFLLQKSKPEANL